MIRLLAGRATSVVTLMALGFGLASCGGDGEIAVSPGGGASGARPAPKATSTGRLTVAVTAPDGLPLANASVTVFYDSQPMTVQTASSNQNGMAYIEGVPEAVIVTVDHPLGYYRKVLSGVQQIGGVSTPVMAVIQPAAPVTVALLPVMVPAAGVSADRTEIELHVSLVASAKAPFIAASYGSYAGSLPTPLLRLEDCYVWLDSSITTPTCTQDTGQSGQVTALEYSYDPVDTSPLFAESELYSALLLLDQSRRVAEYDPSGMRSLAAKHFIRSGRVGGWDSDGIAVAGFAAQDGDASRPPLLPQLPLWMPLSTPYLFSGDRFALEAAVDSLEPLVGGAAPVFEALGAALAVTAGSLAERRVIVALLGGGDDRGLSELQRQAAIASLRQQHRDSGVQVVLIAGQLDEDSGERRNLAELAAALRAPIIYAGYPTEWQARKDGLYLAMDLAADLLAGSAMPSVKAVFRMRSGQPGGFQRGSLLQGTIHVESNLCPMECAELPLQFAVEIP